MFQGPHSSVVAIETHSLEAGASCPLHAWRLSIPAGARPTSLKGEVSFQLPWVVARPKPGLVKERAPVEQRVEADKPWLEWRLAA